MINFESGKISVTSRLLNFTVSANYTFASVSLALIIILYWRIVDYPSFYFQDPDYLNAEVLQRPLGLKTFFSLFKEPIAHNIQPITASVFLLVNNLLGGDIFYLRIISLLLFFISSNLLFRLIFKVAGAYFISFGASLLFIIHPISIEIVAWISSMKYLVALPLILLGLLNYINYTTTNAPKHAILFLVCGILAMLSNPAAVIFPAFVFGIDYLEGKGSFLRLIKMKVIHMLLGLFAIWSSIDALSPNIRMALIEHYFLLKPLAFFAGVGRLIPNVFLPSELTPFHRFGIEEKDLLGLVLMLMVNIVLIMCFFSKRLPITIRWGIAFVLLGIGVNYFQFSSGYLADRYLLFPAIGIIIIITTTVSYFKGRFIFLSLLAAYLLVNNLNYLQVWKSDKSLINHALQKQPETGYLIHLTRGYYFKEKKDYDKCIDHYLQSMVLHFRLDNEQQGKSSFYTPMNVSTFESILQVLSLSSEDQTEKVIAVIDKHAPKDANFYCSILKIYQLKNNTLGIEQTMTSFSQKYPESEICQFFVKN